MRLFDKELPWWVKVLCALVITLGTLSGGWRIIRTMGHKIVRLKPSDGFAAETGAAIVIQSASHLGIPISTTHVISTAIIGVGFTKGRKAVKVKTIHRILWAWILTLPITAALGYVLIYLGRLFS